MRSALRTVSLTPLVSCFLTLTGISSTLAPAPAGEKMPGVDHMTSTTERLSAKGLEYVESIWLPPKGLRDRVHGVVDAESFLEVGRQCSQDIEAILKHIG